VNRRFRWNHGWFWFSALLTLAVAFPIAFILFKVVGSGTELWNSLNTPTVHRYLWNTGWLALGVGVLTLGFGGVTAWLITAYDFPGRRWLGSALILPLVFPAYILAYTYAGIFDFTGPIETTLRGWFGDASSGKYIPFEFTNIYGLIFLLSCNLYPYVYMTMRASFVQQSQRMLELTRSFGVGPIPTFFRVVLPLARPAMVAGLTLCLLEVINDFGAAEYFGVDTFATAIYRTWFSRGNYPLAMRLAAFLMLIVAVILLLEQWQRRRVRYEEGSKSSVRVEPYKLKGWKAWAASLFCFFPFFFGFLLPMLQLLAWTARHFSGIEWTGEFGAILKNTLLLALCASIVTVLCALILAYTLRLFSDSWIRLLSKLALIGYAVPGTVIAVGVMAVGHPVQRWLVKYNMLSTSDSQLYLWGCLLMLFAFLVRFLMVAYSPIDASFQRTGRHFNEAARLLGASPLKTLFRVEIPMISSGLLAAMLLVLIDTLKELPLTLFLQPVGFRTLSTKIYYIAKNMESVEESAVYAVVIALLGLLPVYLIYRSLLRDSHSTSRTNP